MTEFNCKSFFSLFIYLSPLIASHYEIRETERERERKKINTTYFVTFCHAFVALDLFFGVSSFIMEKKLCFVANKQKNK